MLAVACLEAIFCSRPSSTFLTAVVERVQRCCLRLWDNAASCNIFGGCTVVEGSRPHEERAYSKAVSRGVVAVVRRNVGGLSRHG